MKTGRDAVGRGWAQIVCIRKHPCILRLLPYVMLWLISALLNDSSNTSYINSLALLQSDRSVWKDSLEKEKDFTLRHQSLMLFQEAQHPTGPVFAWRLPFAMPGSLTRWELQAATKIRAVHNIPWFAPSISILKPWHADSKESLQHSCWPRVG